MEIPGIYFLIGYGVFAALASLFFVFNLFHIGKFGLQSPKTSYVLAAYTISFIGMLIYTFILLMPYNWNDNIKVQPLIEVNTTTDDLSI